MKVQPVNQYKHPLYPDKESALQQPALLLTAPGRWKRNGVACVALVSVTTMLMTACRTGSTGNTIGKTVVAPLFNHGEGVGGFGCVSVAPPAYLNDYEAQQVIQDTAREAGLEWSDLGFTLDKVNLPRTSTNPSAGQHVAGTKRGSLKLDGIDKDGKIAYEFVSMNDINEWLEPPDPNTWISAETYAYRETADVLRSSIEKTNSGLTMAVFYDPGVSFDDAAMKLVNDCNGDMEMAQEKLKELVKADLRLQVLDFLAWLKAQNII